MRHCQHFESRLISSVPYHTRYGVETTLQSITASRVMLGNLQAEVKHSFTKVKNADEIIVVAFGSYGRLDGHVAVSDFDLVFIYDGDPSEREIARLRKVIRSIVTWNQCLQFDHREAIEKQRFDFDSSPAYPVVSANELRTESQKIRALQLLTEGRIIHGDCKGTVLRHALLRQWGFSQDPTQLNLGRFRAALNEFRDSYCNGVMCKRKTDRWKLTNRKALKVFALREFSYMATMFALAETALAVAVGSCPEDQAVQLLSSPSVLKIASFSSPRGALANILEHVSPQLRNRAITVLKQHIDELRGTKGFTGEVAEVDPAEGAIFAFLRALTLPVGIKYDALLSLLHSAEFMTAIDELEPDITTWLGEKSFQRILSIREEMIAASIRFAKALNDVLELVESGAHLILGDARAALEEIKGYTLRKAV